MGNTQVDSFFVLSVAIILVIRIKMASPVKIREINYKESTPQTERVKKSSKSIRNPIKVVVDMMGDDG